MATFPIMATQPLKPASPDAPKQAKHELSKELSNQTTKHHDPLSKISKKEKEREEREKGDTEGLAKVFSRENEENAKLLSSEAMHSESECLAGAKPCLACLAGSSDSVSIEVELLHAEEQRQANEEHFKTPPRVETTTAGEQAGADLTEDDVALLERIKSRLAEMNAEVTPFALSLAMKGNDHDIGLERCRAWLEASP